MRQVLGQALAHGPVQRVERRVVQHDHTHAAIVQLADGHPTAGSDSIDSEGERKRSGGGGAGYK